MANTTRRVTYYGDPAYVSRLVQMLEDEGVSVNWERPQEHRGGIGEMAHEVMVNLVSVGSLAAITAAVNKFRKLMHDRAEVTVEDDGPDDE